MCNPKKQRCNKFLKNSLYSLLLFLVTSQAFSQSISILTAIVRSCAGEISVSVSGGLAPYSYAWYQEDPADSGTYVLITGETTQQITGYPPGNYRIVVTDSTTPTPETITGEYTISPGFPLLGVANFSGLACVEDPNSGVIMVNFNNGIAPFNWSLSNTGGGVVRTGTENDFFLTVEGLTAGDYILNWSDDNACMGTEAINVAVPGVRDLTVNSTAGASCFGASDGAANVSVNGGWGADYFILLVSVDANGNESQVFNWTNIGTAQNYDITNLSAGTYRVYHQDRLFGPPFSTSYMFNPIIYAACNKFEDFVITEPNEIIGMVTGELLQCFGDTDGNITGTITGGMAPYTIQMDGTTNSMNVATDGGPFDFSGLSSGAYTFTITDASGCTANTQASITEPNHIITNFVISQGASCNAGNDGSITISVTGGTPNYTFTVNGNLVSPTNTSGNNYTLGNLTAGPHTIVVSDQNNCIANQVINQTITEPQAINVAISGETLVCFGDSDGNITGTISGGMAPYTIQLDETGASINVPSDGGSFDFTGLISGTYNFTITDANNCSIGAMASILENDLIANEIITDVTCAAGADGSIMLNPMGIPGPYTYSWTASGGGTIPVGQENNQNITGLSGGDYTITIVDGNNCSFVRTFTIMETTVMTLTNVLSDYNGFQISGFGLSDGSIAVTMTGGVMPYTYAWTASNGGVIPVGQENQEDQTGLVAGDYQLTVTDANGCGIIGQWTLTQPPELLISEVLASHQNVLCFGDTTGVIEVSIDQGSVPNYTITLTDSGTGSVVQQAMNQTGPRYTFSTFASGTYNATVLDANGISKVINNILISQPANGLMISNATISDFNGSSISCNGFNDGSIDLTAMGGTPGYTYSWAGPGGYTATTEDIGSLAPGMYTVTVTDTTGVCVITESYTITEPTALGITSVLSDYNGFQISGFGLSDGSIAVTMTGGVMPYSYAWVASNGGVIPVGQENQEDQTGLVAGDYQLTVTDANGCGIIGQWTLTQPPELLISEVLASHQNVLCFGDTTGVIEVSIDQGSVPNYTITLTDSGTGSVVQQAMNQTGPRYTFSTFASGTYNATVLDANGISKVINNILISQPANGLMISNATISDFNGSSISCNGFNDGSIDLTAMGGTPGYTYSWAGPGGYTATTENIGSLAPGMYTVTVTDTTGVCVITESYTITEPTALGITSVLSDYNGFQISGFGLSDGSIAVTMTGGVMPYSYAWVASNGGVIPVGQENQEDQTGLVAGDYQLTVTDANGCGIIGQWTLTQPPELLISEVLASHQNVLCFGDTTGVIEVSIDQGSVPNYTITLTDSGTGSVVQQAMNQTGPRYIFTNLPAGTYNVAVTDANSIAKMIHGITISFQSPEIIANYTTTDLSCYNDNTGSIVMNVTGGIAPLTYTWNDLAQGP
ncbi:MAG: hypothetical protein GKR88_20620 [Flavobacteriaceae bacterium]|nr:MAG: hypothetical protein GKR88_20620 [Flavobacteriaceae bacterium]